MIVQFGGWDGLSMLPLLVRGFKSRSAVELCMYLFFGGVGVYHFGIFTFSLSIYLCMLSLIGHLWHTLPFYICCILLIFISNHAYNFFGTDFCKFVYLFNT